MRTLAIVFGAYAFLLLTAAHAQDGGAIREHYRAYTVAIERGDLASAEREARLALNASEARDGGAGNTAVLALNHAHVLLDLTRRQEAIAPAQRAFDLAQSQGAEAARIDLTVTELALRRAQLALDGGLPGRSLWEVVQRADAAGGYEDRVYAAAADLGEWSTQRDEFALAESAWRVAINAVKGADEDAILARARALRGLGLALLLRNHYRAPSTTLLGTNVDAIQTDALEPLSEATRITRELARTPVSDTRQTRAQNSFAHSLALLSAASAQIRAMQGLGLSPEVDPELLHGLVVPRAGSNAPLCVVRLSTDRPIRYPRRALESMQVGAIVMRITLGEDGAIVDAEPAAITGHEDFANSVRSAVWRVEVQNGPEGCRPGAVYLRPLTFNID